MNDFVCTSCSLKEPIKYNPKGKQAKELAQKFQEKR